MRLKMEEQSGYIVIDNETTDSSKKKENWDTAIGLQKVDKLTPSRYLLKLSRKNIKGEMNLSEIADKLKMYYKKKDDSDEKVRDLKECDMVSLRIAELLGNESFGFSPVALKTIHGYLFKDIYDFAGQYRNCNIRKNEPILNGETVKYVNYQDIEEYLDYDFKAERKCKYFSMNQQELVKHIAKFTSSIWQVHPFREGNTRTVAVFIEKYLNSMGFHINNDMFKDKSLYFRNALVRSNYADIPNGIYPTFEYLESFFENLLLGKDNQLHNSDLNIQAIGEQSGEATKSEERKKFLMQIEDENAKQQSNVIGKKLSEREPSVDSVEESVDRE